MWCGAGLERSSVLWAIKSINRSDIVLQLIDATQGITDQDLRIAEHILNSKATTIVVVNKWDMSKESKQKVHQTSVLHDCVALKLSVWRVAGRVVSLVVSCSGRSTYRRRSSL